MLSRAMMIASVHAKRRSHDASLLALKPEQRQEYLHKIQTAATYRAWAEQAEQEANAMLADQVWWVADSPIPPCPRRSVAAIQKKELDDVMTEWPDTSNSVYCDEVTQASLRDTRSLHNSTIVLRLHNKRRRGQH